MKGILALILLLPFVAPAAAQKSSPDSAQAATVHGTVRTVKGEALPAVTITAIEAETKVLSSTLTDENGSFRFPSLQAGSYKLFADLQGFQRANRNDVVVGDQPELVVDFTLQPATPAQGVRPAEPLDLPRDLPKRAVRPVRPSPQAVPKPSATNSRTAASINR